MENPHLMDVLNGHSLSGQKKVREAQLTYAQLWINQADLIFEGYRANLIRGKYLDALKKDLGYTFALPIIRHKWETSVSYYSSDFRKFIEPLLTLKSSNMHILTEDIQPNNP